MFENVSMLVLKVTRDCNLRCKYCYIENKDHYRKEVMEFDVFKKIINKIVEDKTKSNKNIPISIVFHGGEPLIIGKKNIFLFLSYAKKTFEDNEVKFNFSFQTNATLIDKELLTILHDFNASVGISFDGSKESNSLRTLMDTDNLSDLILQFKRFNVNYGMLMVVTPTNVDKVLENMEYIKNTFSVKSIKVNYAEDVLGAGECEVEGNQFFEKVQKKILEAYINRELPLEESNLDLIIKNYFRSRFTGIKPLEIFSSSCGLKICGGGSRILEVSPDGGMYFCGRYSKDFEESYISKVYEKDFLSLHHIKRYSDTVKIRHDIIKDVGCDTCIADDICDHGCIAFHFSKFQKWGIREDLSCQIFKPLKIFIVENEEEIFNAWFDSNKDNEGKLYLNIGTPVSEDMLDRMKKIVNKSYIVEIDNKFNSEDGRIPQVVFSKKE